MKKNIIVLLLIIFILSGCNKTSKSTPRKTIQLYEYYFNKGQLEKALEQWDFNVKISKDIVRYDKKELLAQLRKAKRKLKDRKVNWAIKRIIKKGSKVIVYVDYIPGKNYVPFVEQNVNGEWKIIGMIPMSL